MQQAEPPATRQLCAFEKEHSKPSSPPAVESQPVERRAGPASRDSIDGTNSTDYLNLNCWATQDRKQFEGDLQQLIEAIQDAEVPTKFDLQGRTLELNGCACITDCQAADKGAFAAAGAPIERIQWGAGTDQRQDAAKPSPNATTACSAPACAGIPSLGVRASHSLPSNALAADNVTEIVSESQPACQSALAGISAADNSLNAKFETHGKGGDTEQLKQTSEPPVMDRCNSIPVQHRAAARVADASPLQLAHSCPSALCISFEEPLPRASAPPSLFAVSNQCSELTRTCSTSVEVLSPDRGSSALATSCSTLCLGGARGSFPQPKSPVSQAAIVPRMLRKAASATDSFRQSCDMHPRSLAEALHSHADGIDAPHSALKSDVRICITNGTLRLPAGHVLLVEGSGVTLQNVVVEAATAPPDGVVRSVPLLYALRTELLELDGVTVSGNTRGHGFGIGAGSLVRARNCTFSSNWTSGVVLRGPAARFVAGRCTFSANGQDGVSVSDGAAAELEDCTFASNAMLGVGVADAGTDVAAVRCAATGCRDHGFAVSGGAALALERCTADSNSTGVLALGSMALARVSNCELQWNQQGVHAREGAELRLLGSTLAHNRVGARSCDAGTRLAVSNTAVVRSTAAGLQIRAGSSCSLEGGSVSHNAGHGVAVEHRHSCFQANGATFEGNGVSGVHSSVMASARLEKCQLEANKVSGLQVMGSDTSADLEGCSLNNNHTIGAFVNKGARLALSNCELKNNGSSGCEVRERASSLAAIRTQLHENGRVGVYTHSAANAKLDSCTLEGNKAYGLLCGGRGGDDIGGGIITLSHSTELSDGKMVRHGGRIFAEPAETSA